MSDESAVAAVPRLLVEAKNEDVEGEYVLELIDESGYPRYRDNSAEMFLWYGSGAWHFSRAMGELTASEELPSIRSTSTDPTTISPSQLRVWHVHRIAALRTTGDDDDDAQDRGSQFVDPEFPPEKTSLKEPYVDVGVVEWVRVDKLRHPRPVLFGSTTTGTVADPLAPLQGRLLDCWLMAALSSMAEREGCIQHHFVDGLTLPTDGKIRVRLYDYRVNDWVIVIVDTLIPCSKMKSGRFKPLYAQLGTSDPPECWPLILEKAYAKFVSLNYHSLSLGVSQWAWQASTSINQQWYFERRGKDKYAWVKFELDLKEQLAATWERRAAPFKELDNVSFDDSMMFRLMDKFDLNNYLMTCSKDANPDKVEQVEYSGIVKGHVYSILGVFQCDDANGCGAIRLVKLRNPWGAREWTGPWADASAEWAAHPKIYKSLAPYFSNDGVFYMSYEDWRTEFLYLSVSPAENSVLATAKRVHPQPTCDTVILEKRLKRAQEPDLENHGGNAVPCAT
eukprot:GEMP01035298.1.p1 GENE.GEMP01035298.1~~GEMP01035298.1.p1  ORF type:complete len:507 (-),score=132.57 GEMP01035298.1:261-1781(-)